MKNGSLSFKIYLKYLFRFFPVYFYGCLWDSLAMTSAGPMLMPMLMLLLLLLFALLLPEGVKNYKIATKCKLNRRGSRRKKKYKKNRTTIAPGWKITLGNPISWPFCGTSRSLFGVNGLWNWIMQGLHYRWISKFFFVGGSFFVIWSNNTENY